MKDSAFVSRLEAKPEYTGSSNSHASITFLISYFDPMQSFAIHLLHLIFYGVLTVSGKAIDARAKQEVRVQFFGRAEEFVEITLYRQYERSDPVHSEALLLH